MLTQTVHRCSCDGQLVSVVNLAGVLLESTSVHSQVGVGGGGFSQSMPD